MVRSRYHERGYSRLGKTPRVLVTTYGSVRHAPRVIHAGRSAAENGYEVHVIGAPRESFAPQAGHEVVEGMNAYLIPLMTRLHPGAFGMAVWRWLRGRLPSPTVPMPHGRSSLRTAFNILLFNLWILRLGRRIRPGLVHCHELWGLPASWLLARWYRVPVVYDVWDPLQDGKTFKGRIAGQVERFLAQRCDAIIASSAHLERRFRQVSGPPTCLIANWKRLEDYDQISADQITQLREALQLEEAALVVSYIGLLYRPRAILPLLEAVERLPEVVLLIAGRGDYRDAVIQLAEESPNIRWLDWVALKDVPLYTLASDVVYLCFEDDASAHQILPNKLYETFTAGKVMLARRGIGEMGDILEETGAGYLIDDCTPAAIRSALMELQRPEVIGPLRANARRAREVYNWSLGEERLLNLYRQLLSRDC